MFGWIKRLFSAKAVNNDHVEQAVVHLISKRYDLLPPETPVADHLDELIDARGVQFSPCAVRIRYSDASDNVTLRTITLQKLSRGYSEGQLLVTAYCHHRRAPRSFRADRIHELVVLETGECPNNIAEWLKQTAISTESAARLNRLVEKYKARLSLLAFVAIADGSWSDEEKRVVASDFLALAGRQAANIDPAAVQQIISRLTPDPSLIPVAIVRYGSTTRRANKLKKVLAAIAAADGVTTEEELNALSLLNQKMDEAISQAQQAQSIAHAA